MDYPQQAQPVICGKSYEWAGNCHFGDVRDVLRQMIAGGVKVNCIVTSPPYWNLRSYLPADHPDKAREIGSEPTLREFIETMVGVFDLAREVLAEDGTMWVNMGDSYATGTSAPRNDSATADHGGWANGSRAGGHRADVDGLKPKNLVGQPWRLAFALQDAGWWLRQDIIWHKPNPMPESIRDRCTKAHEYLFLLTKAERYYWDFEAMQEPVNGGAHARRPSNGVGFGYADEAPKPRTIKAPDGWATHEGGHGSFHKEGCEKGKTMADPNVGRRVTKAHLAGNVNPPKGQLAYEAGDESHRTKGGLLAYAEKTRKLAEAGSGTKNNDSMDEALADMRSTRNRRSVWTIPSEPFKGAHFATFPRALIEPCILAGCPPRVCTQCLSPATREPDANAELPDLQEPVPLLPVGCGKDEILQQAMPIPVHADGGADIGVLGVRSDIQPGPSEQDGPLLQQGLRGPQHGARAGHVQGLLHDDEGLRHGLRAGTPGCDEGRLRDAASAGDGEEVGPSAPAFGGGSPQKRDQERQQTAEPGVDDQEGARPAAEAGDQAHCVSALPRANRPLWTCKKCKADLSKPGAVGPGVVLDIFLGSGTTAQVAEQLGRKWIGIDIDQRNEALQRGRLRQPSLELAA